MRLEELFHAHLDHLDGQLTEAIPLRKKAIELSVEVKGKGEIAVLGDFSYHPTFHAQALEAIQRGVIRADQIVTHTVPLDEIAHAFEIASSGQGLKVMVTTS